MYSRHFLTTAADRQERMLRRASLFDRIESADAGMMVGGGQCQPSAPPLPPVASPSVLITDMATIHDANAVPAAHSTRVGNQNVGGARNTDVLDLHNNSMMEIEERLPQTVTFDPNCLSVDVQQCENHDIDFWSVNANSDVTQYRDFPVATRREAGNVSQTNPFLPGYSLAGQNGNISQNPVPHANPVLFQNCGVPGQVMYTNFGQRQQLGSNQQHIPVNTQLQLVPATNQGLFSSNDLSKTDRTVLMELIKNVSVADGADEIMLLNFLRELKPLFDIAPASSSHIVKLLIPKTKGQLFKLWLDASTANLTWDELHQAILGYFLPIGRLRELETLELDRPQ